MSEPLQRRSTRWSAWLLVHRLRPGRLRDMVFGGGAALVAVLLGAVSVIGLGAYNVAASSPHDALSYWITSTTMVHSVRRHARGIVTPPTLTQGQAIGLGFALYERHCVACHGAPGVAQAPWVDGLTPRPPYLLDATRQWTPSELYWIVRHGIKMTAMPAWEFKLTEDETWRLVAFLEALPRLNRDAYCRMRMDRPGSSAREGATPATPAQPGDDEDRVGAC
jgi:hypothetical protein